MILFNWVKLVLRNKLGPAPLLVLVPGIAVFLAGCATVELDGNRGASPRDYLPSHIVEVEEVGAGARAVWSPDGDRFMYIDGLVGEVYEFELATREIRPITAHFSHHGFTRVNYLANGDILLCGPEDVDPDDPHQGRWDTVFWILDRDLNEQAVRLDDERCFEGPAVSRRDMRIAWALTDYPEQREPTYSEIWVGDIDLTGSSPRLVNKRKVVDRADVSPQATFEPQDFQPPHEEALIFTAYAYRGGEVMGVDLDSGEVRNYSQNAGYEEAEGISPDGRYILVEREDAARAEPLGEIDIWLMPLDGSGDFSRLTYFNDFEGFGANNPVISPDGRYMLFQLRIVGGKHGNSDGLFLYDLKESPHTPRDFSPDS